MCTWVVTGLSSRDCIFGSTLVIYLDLTGLGKHAALLIRHVQGGASLHSRRRSNKNVLETISAKLKEHNDQKVGRPQQGNNQSPGHVGKCQNRGLHSRKLYFPSWLFSNHNLKRASIL